MKIKALANLPVEEVITCFLTAFESYFVKLPADVEYWKNRFTIARVDWSLSYGMFEEEKLVGFIINGIDNHNGRLSAYNTGTGILPEYRGKAIVDQLYRHAIPLLKEHGVEKCLLEVICENERAIKVYERIGFSIKRKLISFSGTLHKNSSAEELQKSDFSAVLDLDLYKPEHYSWDNSAEAVKMQKGVSTFYPGRQNPPESYLSIDAAGNIIQVESEYGDYEKLLKAAGNVVQEVKLKNVDSGRSGLIEALQKLHFSKTVGQFEMEKFL